MFWMLIKKFFIALSWQSALAVERGLLRNAQAAVHHTLHCKELSAGKARGPEAGENWWVL